MKHTGRFVSGLLVAGMMLALANSLCAQSAQQSSAKVVNIKGSARYMTVGDATWHPLKVGTVLKPGAIVQTASGSYADLVLYNEQATASSASSSSSTPLVNASYNSGAQARVEQDAVRIFENTVLGINKLTTTQTGADRVTETELDLKHGRILGTVKKLSAASKYEVTIPGGVAGIKGTIFLLSSDGELSVLSSLADLEKLVPSGSVVLAYTGADGNIVTQVVGDGQHFDKSSGQLVPISDPERTDMIGWARELGISPGAPMTFLVEDHTIYFVSPTSGQTPLP